MADAAHDTKDSGSLSRRADDMLGFAEKQKRVGAEQIGGMAEAVHQAANVLERQMPRTAQSVHHAADGLDHAARALRERGVEDMARSIGDLARAQPAVFFGAAALAGFALSRFLKSSAEPERRADASPHQTR